MRNNCNRAKNHSTMTVSVADVGCEFDGFFECVFENGLIQSVPCLKFLMKTINQIVIMRRMTV